MYEESIRYYVRALAMNPKADNAWQYLRISLRYALVDEITLVHANAICLDSCLCYLLPFGSCASRNDMFEACDSRNLDILQKEFPL